MVVSVRSSLPQNVQQSFLNQSLDPQVPSNQNFLDLPPIYICKRLFSLSDQTSLCTRSLAEVGAFANSNAERFMEM